MKAFVYDDERTIRNILKKTLQKEGIEVLTFENAKNAVENIQKEKPDIVFLDIFLGEDNGLEVLEKISALEEKPYVVMISGRDDYNYIIEAMKLGAYDYIPKPFDISKIRKIVSELSNIIETKKTKDISAPEVVGKSVSMQNVFKLVGRAGIGNDPVLITGESGTGKEVIAKLIHKYSDRADKPFIAVNCAAIPPGLVETELFGHEKGAFTGADRSRKGKFLEANGGTIFLDEISELPYETQGKLLRVLQEMEVSPVGSNKVHKIDVRVIAATNKNLIKLIVEGKFREDLFYRLAVIEINLPPLRERKEDIPLLVDLFTKEALKKYKLKTGGFTEEAVEVLKKYDFPGNVRELKNIVNKLIALYRERPITPNILEQHIFSDTKISPSKNTWEELYIKEVKNMLMKNKKNIYLKLVEEAEKIVIEEVLKHTGGNISEAAKYLGIHRNTVHRKIDELDIDIKRFKN